MVKRLQRLWAEEAGQDLIEYTLLLAFVVLVSAGVFIQAGTVTSGIWITANSVLTSASKAAS